MRIHLLKVCGGSQYQSVDVSILKMCGSVIEGMCPPWRAKEREFWLNGRIEAWLRISAGKIVTNKTDVVLMQQ